MNFAIARGHIEKNPTQGIRPNRRPPLTRLLSREEIGRLHKVFNEDAARGERFRQPADIVRLLLLTGWRRSEIVCRRWSEVRDRALLLADAKTGSRTVPLNRQARCILDRQPRGASAFMFPTSLDRSHPRYPDLSLWYRVRREAGIEDVRLQDLRRTHASHAEINGVPMPMVARLLGHSNFRMTMRYTHHADRDIESAAERVGAAIARIMTGKTSAATGEAREPSEHGPISLTGEDR